MPGRYADFATNNGRVVGVQFDVFLKWLADVWQPGQHMAVIAPTGEGKTTFVKPILDLRKWVMVLDPKGMDDTVEKYGYTRITELPLPKKMRQDIAEGKPAHIVVGTDTHSEEEDEALKHLLRQALAMARKQMGWTIYIDEFQIFADRRMMSLDKQIERMLIAARKDRSSVVTGYQAAAWIPKASTRQARIAAIGPTRDRQMIKNIAEAMGRNWQELALIIDEIPKFHWVVIPRDVRAPVLIVNPPKL